MQEIPEIDVIQSTSRLGISSDQIELSAFTPDGRIKQIWSKVRDARSDAARQFPPSVPEPKFDSDRTGAFTVPVWITPGDNRQVPPSIMGRLAEDLQGRLRQVPLTKLVALHGEPEEELRVEMDADAMAALGLMPAVVAQAIGKADTKVSAGRVRGGTTYYPIELKGETDSIDRVCTIPLLTSSDEQVVRVGDIATIMRAERTPPSALAYVNGERTVRVAARIEDDKQVDVWAVAISTEIEGARAELPAGLDMKLVFDQSTYTADRLGEVAVNLLIGVGLVVGVQFVSMGWRSTMIMGTMLPLTSLIILEKWGPQSTRCRSLV